MDSQSGSRVSAWRKFSLYWHTVRHLRPVQLYGRLGRKRSKQSRGETPSVREQLAEWVPALESKCGWSVGRRFEFLGVERGIESWNDAGVPKLWLYNLHYQAGATEKLIRWWIEENPPLAGNGWEPYPLSLRMGNWLRWLLQGNAPAVGMLASLAQQARVLEQTVEWHLLGNHLFVNGKALLWVGSYFEGAEAERWRQLGMRILRAELEEQVLGDGGHFERSPMYHALAAEDVLDVVNLERAYGDLGLGVREKAGTMLGWLEQMRLPSGGLVFFNDTTEGVAPAYEALREYGERLGIKAGRRELGDSGFVRLEGEGAVVWMDAGSVGPSYQPGHAHAGTLSIEVVMGGRRVLGNAGISTYEKNAQRQAERGTGAHSTVRVDGEDSSEVWGGFRVARRAKVVSRETDGKSWVEAAHDGYGRLGRGLVHRRRVEIRAGEVRVTDRVEGKGRHVVEVLYHMAPGETGERVGLDEKMRREERVGEFHGGYGKTEAIVTVVGVWEGELPGEWVSVIRRDVRL